jgi:uncharacterized protein (TIGR03663 family)
MNRGFALGLLLAAGLAVALRGPQLDRRPMHNDEAVNAIKFGTLWERGDYKYDPNEHHGPSLYYATLALNRLTGAPDFAAFTEARLRIVPALFGVGLILLLPLVRDALGRGGTLWAAMFTAVCPALVFYSRYYIHEMLLVFFTFLLIAAVWRWTRSRKVGWALLAGAALGLMHATKETFVITLAAMALALVLNGIWNRWLATGSSIPEGIPWPKHVLAAVGVWLVVAVIFFSSFFTNPGGLLDSIRTYLPWLNRAGGDSPHIHPWNFYLERLVFFHPARGPVWTEAVIFALAAVAVVAAFKREALRDAHAGFIRFLAVYALALTAAYSFIPYKTPWCLLSFWHGWILLAGIGAMVLARLAWRPRFRIFIGALLFAALAHLAWQAWQLSLPRSADRRNPYVYAHTSPDLLNLVGKIQALAQAHSQRHQMLLKVMAAGDDYWPLPWYLRRFPHVGWWNEVPADPYAPVMIVSADLQAELDANGTHLMAGYFELRPAVFLELYVALDLWRAYLDTLPRAPD